MPITNRQAVMNTLFWSRLIAWTILVVILGGAAFFAWSAIAEGKVVRLVVTLAFGAVVAWASYRNAVGAKSR